LYIYYSLSVPACQEEHSFPTAKARGIKNLSLPNYSQTEENRLVNGRVEIFKRTLIRAGVRPGVAWRSEENTTRHLLAGFPLLLFSRQGKRDYPIPLPTAYAKTLEAYHFACANKMVRFQCLGILNQLGGNGAACMLT